MSTIVLPDKRKGTNAEKINRLVRGISGDPPSFDAEILHCIRGHWTDATKVLNGQLS